MLIVFRWRASRLGGGIRGEIILHQVGPLIDNAARAFQSLIVNTLMVIHVFWNQSVSDCLEDHRPRVGPDGTVGWTMRLLLA